LDDTALELHFASWSGLTSLRWDFDVAHDEDWSDHTDSETAEQWIEYVTACQPDLRSSAAVLHQSTEIALKARICRVSPYLLVRMDGRPSAKVSIDFSDLRTIDAVDLPYCVNALTPEPLSDVFIERFSKYRMERNRVMHLGRASERLELEELLHRAIFLYKELWPNRAWLEDRVKYGSVGAASFFHDGRYSSAEAAALHEWPFVEEFLTKGEFKALFGVAKSARRYRCFDCEYSASTKGFSPDGATIVIRPRPDELACLMCAKKYAVERGGVCQNACEHPMIAVDPAERQLRCHYCGAPDD